MKFQTVLVLFTVAVSACSAPPKCKGPLPAHCRYTSNRDAKECRQLFAQRSINIATCQPSASTVTSTRTICATSVTTKILRPPRATKKITSVITKTGKPTTQSTITLTATSTAIDTTTVTDTTTTTEVDTVTQTDTDTITDIDTTTTTTTTTTAVPYAPQTTCAVPQKRGVVFGRSYKKPLPASCACFLTTTRSAAVKTATVTKKKPAVTQTVYKFGGPRQTITRTIIVARYIAGPTLSAPETTKTVTTTITQTDRTLTTATDEHTTTATETETETETETQTETATTTATAIAGPCDDVSRLKVSGGRSLSNPNAVLSSAGDAFGPNGAVFCCKNCFLNPDCVFFRVANELCEIFTTRRNVVNPCTSDRCRRGRTPLIVGPPDGRDYFLGECPGPQIA